MLDPFAQLVDAFADRVDDIVARRIGAALTTEPTADAPRFDYWRLYSAEEAEHISGIPKHELYRDLAKPYRSARPGAPTAVCFHGINLLMYLHGLPSVDVHKMLGDLRESIVARLTPDRPSAPALVRTLPQRGDGSSREVSSLAPRQRIA